MDDNRVLVLMEKLCLVIWLDAFRIDYLDEAKTPFIYKLSKQGLTCLYQPLLSFEGLGASIFRGVIPLKHGVWTEFCYSPEASPLRWTSGLTKLGRIIDKSAESLGKIGYYFRAGINFSLFKLSNALNGRSYMPMALQIPSRATALLNYFDRHFCA